MAKAGFTLRNEGTYLGVFWYLLNPFLLCGLLFFIFSERLGEAIAYYPLYLLLGVVMFNFFQQATTEATRLIDEKKWIIQSINFPREALPVSTTIKALFSHGFEVVAFGFFMVILGVPVWQLLLYVPIFFCFAVFVCGVALGLAAVTVYIADLENIWLFASRLLFLGTPIFYAIEKHETLFLLNTVNPLYYYFTAARNLVIYGQIPAGWVLEGVVGFAVFSLVIGFVIFKTLQGRFAEML